MPNPWWPRKAAGGAWVLLGEFKVLGYHVPSCQCLHRCHIDHLKLQGKNISGITTWRFLPIKRTPGEDQILMFMAGQGKAGSSSCGAGEHSLSWGLWQDAPTHPSSCLMLGGWLGSPRVQDPAGTPQGAPTRHTAWHGASRWELHAFLHQSGAGSSWEHTRSPGGENLPSLHCVRGLPAHQM